MARFEDLLEELVGLGKEIVDKLDGIQRAGSSAGGGGSGGGPSSIAAKASEQKGLGGSFAQGFTGALRLPTSAAAAAGLAGSAVAGGLAAGVAGGVAVAGAAGSAFIESGGSLNAAAGGADRLISRGINAIGLGGLTGDSAALNIQQRAQSDVGSLADATARAGAPLSDQALGVLLQNSTAREQRVEDSRRRLGAVANEQFGDLKAQERDKAGERFSQAVDRLVQALNARSGF